MLNRFRTLIIALSFATTVYAQGDKPQSEPPAGTKIVHPADGAIMVYVPSGSFIMGIDKDEANKIAVDLGFKDYETLWAWDAFPRRTVYLDGFFIDQNEVTVEQWRKFAEAQPEPAKTPLPSNSSEQPEEQTRPAGSILWAQAQLYANWADKALPTEAHWEKAARGTDGRIYPWGNDPPTAEHVLLATPKGMENQALHIGRFPRGASPYGALDMLGNQYEWVSEWLEPYQNNPEAEKMKEYVGHRNGVLRGGSVYHGPVGFYAAKRMALPPDETHFHIGFRTIWQPPAGYFDSPDFEMAQAKVAEREKELKALASTQPATEPAVGTP